MGSSDVIGKTYSELKSLLSLNNVENIAVSTLGGTNLTYTNNKLNLDTSLTGMTEISSSSGNFKLKSELKCILFQIQTVIKVERFYYGKQYRTSGGSLIELMRLDGPTVILVLGDHHQVIN